MTGGFIKNAILSALSISVSRDGDNPIVCQKDLVQGANLQLRGRLRMKDFDRRVVPVAGLDEVIVEEAVMKQLREIVQFEKARYSHYSQSIQILMFFFIQSSVVWAVGICETQPPGSNYSPPWPTWDREDHGGRGYRL